MPNFIKFALPSVAGLSVAFAVGAYVGSSQDAQAQKLDRVDFDQYVSRVRQQYLIDSVNTSNQWRIVNDRWEQDRRLWKRVLCKMYQECE